MVKKGEELLCKRGMKWYLRGNNVVKLEERVVKIICSDLSSSERDSKKNIYCRMLW